MSVNWLRRGLPSRLRRSAKRGQPGGLPATASRHRHSAPYSQSAWCRTTQPLCFPPVTFGIARSRRHRETEPGNRAYAHPTSNPELTNASRIGAGVSRRTCSSPRSKPSTTANAPCAHARSGKLTLRGLSERRPRQDIRHPKASVPDAYAFEQPGEAAGTGGPARLASHASDVTPKWPVNTALLSGVGEPTSFNHRPMLGPKSGATSGTSSSTATARLQTPSVRR